MTYFWLICLHVTTRLAVAWSRLVKCEQAARAGVYLPSTSAFPSFCKEEINAIRVFS